MSDIARKADNVVRAVLRPKQAAPYMAEGLSTFWARAKSDPDHPKTFKLGGKTTVVLVADCDAYLLKKRAAIAHELQNIVADRRMNGDTETVPA